MFLLLAAALSHPVAAAHQYREKEYQQHFCARLTGTTEYLLDDGTRVDCLTDDYAIEVDFAAKWAESVGQSLYYALRTGKRPGVLLILEDPDDERFMARLKALAGTYHIRIWTITPQQLTPRPTAR